MKVKCKKCHKEKLTNWVGAIGPKLAKKRLCFRCNWWYERRGREGQLIFKGKLYNIFQQSPGLDSFQATIQLDEANPMDVWLIPLGEIPTIFKRILPDTGIIVDRKPSKNYWCRGKLETRRTATAIAS